MKAAVLKRYATKLQIQDLAIPKLGPNQILLKMLYSTVNPSDAYFVKGIYGDKKDLPVVPGFEGVGIVEDCGSELATQEPNLKDELELVHKSPAAVQTAAMSDVGKFLRLKLQEAKIPLINIVRREEQVSQLKSSGFPFSLDSTAASFERELKGMAQELDARIAFDAVSGSLTGKVFNRLPANSTVYVYGSLSLKMVEEINPVDLIFKQKQIKGLHLVHNFLAGRSLKEFNEELRADHAKGLITSRYQREISLEEVDGAIPEYMSELGKGKLLIKLN